MRLKILISTLVILIASPSVAEPIIVDKDIQTLKYIDDQIFKTGVDQFKNKYSSDLYVKDELTKICVDSLMIDMVQLSLAGTRVAFETAALMESEREVIIATVGARRILENAISRIHSARTLAEAENLSCAKVPAYVAEKAGLIDQLSKAEGALRPIRERIGAEGIVRSLRLIK